MRKLVEKFHDLKWLGPVTVIMAFLIAANVAHAERLYGAGEYYLGQDIKTASGLIESTPGEHGMLQSFPGWVDVPGEMVYDAPDVAFNHNRWHLLIGAVDGKIDFMVLQYMGSDRTEADKLLGEALKYVKSRMGEPTEQTDSPEGYLWDSPDGSVILAKREAIGFWAINFVLTGRGTPTAPNAPAGAQQPAPNAPTGPQQPAPNEPTGPQQPVPNEPTGPQQPVPNEPTGAQ